ncbi:cysteine-rich receptor-like protein kinase 15 isoform X1 [Senna tora]|uniref:Cysteine-rich receptor-like protein kinase 15 isoform X1 n=1 Tax=Senna tora TaxID=362788 RepID=A0A834X9I0_9FABA|nr:cysteine-rich receptor-like protein kinase 15 isoform X1 [Senna tora]
MFLFKNSLLLYGFLLTTLVASQVFGAPAYDGHYCKNDSSYLPNSTFQRNLDVLLSSLVSNASQDDTGSYNGVMGFGTTDAINGHYLCRGDLTVSACHDCVAAAADQIILKCPNQTEAVIWYDVCTLRFTNSYFRPDSLVPGMNVKNESNVSSAEFNQFNQTVFGLLDDLSTEAANSQTQKKYAVGESAVATSSMTVYGLAQCLADLNSEQCETCVQNAAGTLPTCCGGSQGARVLLASCNVRYELYRFYNETTSSPPASSGKKKFGAGTIAMIVVLVLVFIILVCLGCYFLLRRSRKSNRRTILRQNFGLESANLESLLFNLATVEAATNKFSHQNKIGHGGFGEVYKVMQFFGYMSPEYAMHGQFSEKSDVFSFGVITLEVISGKRNARSLETNNVDDLLSHTWRHWRDGTPLEILDSDLKEACPHSEVIRCIQLGLLCVQENPDDRPTMAKIVSYLSSPSTELPLPRHPGFLMHNGIAINIGAGESSSGSKSLFSVNDVTISSSFPSSAFQALQQAPQILIELIQL